ncbi:transcriptional regulator family: Histone-like TF [Aspergillus niger]|uniref:Transcription factor CBF/NF-Y/archaeal histone domain-containing protein n=3 Tax=Aspergillus niger TaxID=5061 RepID=A0A254UAH1_ASPNG|nr:CBF/NF-Y family transcription factor [Aspergillus niger CBS 513.88]XP_025456760.1 CBF/NF-Y family transcription factor [Aspergillus niger CBS 101883]EHA27850.1 CCAAT-binding factor [Aspergillus niger ATCC 1015]KAI2813616.1 transcriptional regulator family: Histone-like TF [Aspergillus niger]RDH25731.1 CBF/NF-Y family transcription factor [Aspergillus niger ATCC 13496]KAI2830659.1 transcriptional regulator family: Histone-like TF [Aspergillus niger]KAI2844703.1 transcriptional regulator fam|eukprot:XP_001401031.2 CBF/NF-Y family transcription factor [Aspergillus niger CBS 513.88]
MPPKDKAAAEASSSREITGQSALPISRIKKIIQLDDDIVQCSSNATFVIAMATELFIQYLTEQGHNVVKSERKPRKLIQYKDLATAVSRIDNLEFLSDVIPKTTTYKQFKEKRAKEKEPGPEKGQRTLNGNLPAAVEDKEELEEQQSLQPVDDKPSRGSRPPTVTMMVDRTVDTSAGDQDVEMTDQ